MKNVSDADMRTNLRLISGNGDMSNNIIMHPSIAMGEEPHTRYLVTALWDWGPVASWDNGTHWPSWQTPDDGATRLREIACEIACEIARDCARQRSEGRKMPATPRRRLGALN